MRITLLLFSGFFSAVLFSSCQQSVANTPPPDPASLAFDTYLRSNFGDSIGTDAHVYLLVANKGGRDQAAQKMKRLKKLLNGLPLNKTTVFISCDMPLPDSLLPIGKCRTDWDGAVDHLGFLSGGVTILRTQNGQIETLETVIDQQEKELEALFTN